MKGIRLIPDDTKIPFMRFSRFGYLVSGILCAASLLLFIFNGLNMGVDFKGGTVITIRTAEAANLDELRSTINGLGLGAAELQEFGSPNDVLIRIGTQDGGEGAQQAAVNKIKAALGTGVEYRSVDVVGPKVSGELTQQGILAVVVALFLVLVYVWFRFEWQFALGAIASLMHDVILTIGLFSLLGLEFNLSIIAAILTIIGYSLNDTVVIYDRIREQRKALAQMSLLDQVDVAVNATLTRSLYTSFTTLLPLLALIFFGGSTLFWFAVALSLGIAVGSWSSIGLAPTLLPVLSRR